MKNYLIVNHFLKFESFDNLYKALQQAFEKRGEKLEILTNIGARELLKENGNGAPVLFFDKDIYLAKLLEKSGYRCVNNAFVIETCDDKAKTYLALKDKFRMPKTILCPYWFDNLKCETQDFLHYVANQLSYPLVVKENKGSFGAQVYLANDFNELKGLVEKIGHCKILFQEFIKDSAGKDLRVYVVKGKTVAYALRSNDNDFRSNVNSGGKMQTIEVDKSYLRMAEEITNYLGADFAGIDLLFGEQPILCEVNSNAHFNALSSVSGVDVGLKIADYYLSLKN